MILIKIIYSIAVNIRNFMYDSGLLSPYKSSIPVISVGNITTGGTGKTPFVIFMTNYLKGLGYKPLIVSRGYKRQTSQQILVTRNHQYQAEEIGDEPFLISQMCHNVDVLVNKSRVEAAKWAEKQNKKYDCIILDDAFQHRALHRDFNILLINGDQNMQEYPPQGDLREPFKNIKRADCVVITKAYQPKNKLFALTEALNIPILYAGSSFQIKEQAHPGKGVSFCGIANPSSFLQTLSQLKIKIKEHTSFQDHQKYDEATLGAVEAMLNKNKTTFFYTTRKDWVKLPKEFLRKYTGFCVDMYLSIDSSICRLKLKELLRARLKK
tara:strand:- start:454 stop:1425 length:972 start_codon:yes stop_codon:yes gene_type:complete